MKTNQKRLRGVRREAFNRLDEVRSDRQKDLPILMAGMRSSALRSKALEYAQLCERREAVASELASMLCH